MSKNQAQPPQYVLSGRVKSQSRPSRWKTGYWGEEGDTFLHRQLSASHILNSRAKVCKERFTLSSGTFHFSTLLSHTRLTRPYFPIFCQVVGGRADPIMSTKYSNFPSSTQNIASLSSCVESSGVFSPPHLPIFCPVRLKHGAASMAAQPCDGPFKWASWGERLSRESHFNEEFLAFVIVSIIWFLLGELHPKKVQETSIYFCNLTCRWLTKCSESPVCGLQS